MRNSLWALAIAWICTFLFVFNTVFWFLMFMPVILVMALVPIKIINVACSQVLIMFATYWTGFNSLILKIFYDVSWDVAGLDGLDPHDSYLVISNHRSWADIFVLQHLFRHKIPFLKFFLKKELIWVPILGICWWALDFPFMKRYSRQFLEKHPEFRGKDMETTRKYCEKFKNYPVSVINFLEGTRFDQQKHQAQSSPFTHLLSPKAGGIALVLTSMGDYLTYVLDVTIVYPENQPPVHFWHLLKGDITHIIVRVSKIPVPQDVVGKSYEDDQAFRENIQNWVNQLWQAKDRQIDDLIKHYSLKKT